VNNILVHNTAAVNSSANLAGLCMRLYM